MFSAVKILYTFSGAELCPTHQEYVDAQVNKMMSKTEEKTLICSVQSLLSIIMRKKYKY